MEQKQIYILVIGETSRRANWELNGYKRSTNPLLREQKNRYVAYDSRHLRANAIDFTIPGEDMKKVFYIARRLRIGGIGYYGKNNFVHIDIEGHRVWSY